MRKLLENPMVEMQRSLADDEANENKPVLGNVEISSRSHFVSERSNNRSASHRARASLENFVVDELVRGSEYVLEKICSAPGWTLLNRAFRTYVDRSRSAWRQQTQTHVFSVEAWT